MWINDSDVLVLQNNFAKHTVDSSCSLSIKKRSICFDHEEETSSEGAL